MQGLIPRPFIDELLSRTDIVEFIDSFVPLKKRGTSHLACCPFHHEKTPSFNVIPKKQFYHCFGCGASGNAISFAMNYLHQAFPDAIETLAARAGMQVPREQTSDKINKSMTLYQLLQKVAQFYQHYLKASGQDAITYLKQRGVSGEIARQYQIGFAPPGWRTLESEFKQNKEDLLTTGMIIQKDDGKTYDRYRQRIMFPIHDRQGRIIGFGGRTLDNAQKPKYLNSPETVLFQKSRELYGLHQIIQQQTTNPNILIVEGYLDVIALAQHGISNAVATLGTATSTYHIQLLSKHTHHLIFCFDGDAAGRQAAWRALESSLPHLDSGLHAQFIFLPDGHDPDSLVREEGKSAFMKRIETAIPFHRFFFDTLLQGIDNTNLTGKSQLVIAAKPYLLKMVDGPYRQLLIDELARITRIENHRILQLITEKTTTQSLDKQQHTNQTIARTPMRIAIALLLQHPEIYTECAHALKTMTLSHNKHRVLQQLIQQIAQNPTINTATLVESWRGSPLFDTLNKLASWNHQVPDNALSNEFVEIVLFIEKQNQENKIQFLIEKARNLSLTETERQELQTMLKQRHTLPIK
ncbi:MAG: DNA primase [Legionellaceae bacterium]|nr:DNA primase [Legionellaceae bacterium]